MLVGDGFNWVRWLGFGVCWRFGFGVCWEFHILKFLFVF